MNSKRWNSKEGKMISVIINMESCLLVIYSKLLQWNGGRDKEKIANSISVTDSGQYPLQSVKVKSLQTGGAFAFTPTDCVRKRVKE
jgi:hypothetical protein